VTDTDGNDRSSARIPVALVLALGFALLVAAGTVGAVTGPRADDAGETTLRTTNDQVQRVIDPTASQTASEDRFAFRVQRIERCGVRCRTVNVRLKNTADDPARDVRVRTRVTSGGARVWRGSEDVGTMRPNESVTLTRRVQVGILEMARITANDGDVRIQTTVRWDGGRTTFDRRTNVL